MNTNAAFKALTAIRKNRQNKGGFSVYLVTKSGAPSKVKNRDYSGQTEFNLEQAQAYKARLEANNPGRNWVILPV